MTTELFFEWLSIVDDHIAKTHNGRIALLVDNAKVHGNVDTLPTLPHIDVIYLPANTTSRVQPLDSGVIASLKKRYRNQQLSRAIDLLENGSHETTTKPSYFYHWNPCTRYGMA